MAANGWRLSSAIVRLAAKQTHCQGGCSRVRQRLTTEPVLASAKAFDASHLLEPASVEQSEVNIHTAALPATRVARLWEYGRLGLQLGWSWAGSSLRPQSANPSQQQQWSERDLDRVASTLARMRGAALKLGQMLSIQDGMLPVATAKDSSSEAAEEMMLASTGGQHRALQRVIQRVQNGANAMPQWQMERQMTQSLGADWRSRLFHTFHDRPFAAASIGQVHYAELKDGCVPVAVKVQYPGVGASIQSDLQNIKSLLALTSLMPRGLYLENTIRVAQQELLREVDYRLEAEAMERFRALLMNDPTFYVPKVYHDLCTNMVLVTEFRPGIPLGQLESSPQLLRDHIGTHMLRLCLQELFDWRFMQTDPNFSNFLYDKKSGKVILLDFGASRDLPDAFVDTYRRLLIASVDGRRQESVQYSIDLGFLTGDETETMISAHLGALLSIAMPFQRPTSPDTRFDFGSQSITTHVRKLIPVMLQYRLTPPPDESYSVHRKLSGGFLLCTRLRSRVRCYELFDRYRDHAAPVIAA